MRPCDLMGLKSCMNRKWVIFLRTFVTMGTCKDPVGLMYIFVFTFLIRAFHNAVVLLDVTNTTQNRVFQFVSVSSTGHWKPLNLPTLFPLQVFASLGLLKLSSKRYVTHHASNWWYISKISSDFLLPSYVGHEDSKKKKKDFVFKCKTFSKTAISFVFPPFLFVGRWNLFRYFSGLIQYVTQMYN